MSVVQDHSINSIHRKRDCKNISHPVDSSPSSAQLFFLRNEIHVSLTAQTAALPSAFTFDPNEEKHTAE